MIDSTIALSVIAVDSTNHASHTFRVIVDSTKDVLHAYCVFIIVRFLLNIFGRTLKSYVCDSLVWGSFRLASINGWIIEGV